MIKDPRSKNVLFNSANGFAYLKEYSENLLKAVQQVDPEAFETALNTLEFAVGTTRRIYVAGNGGSAAISDHLCCDFTKGARSTKGATLRTQSLVSNMALFSAIGNDHGYEETIAFQVEVQVQAGDVVILISSSGNSPNIIKAAKVAKSKGATVIGFTGFSGGELKSLADISLHVPFNNYGIVEDAHQMLMHTMAQMILIRLEA